MNEKRRFIFAIALMLVLILTPARVEITMAHAVTPLAKPEKSFEEHSIINRVDFTVTAAAMQDALETDVKAYGTPEHLGWIELLAYLGQKYVGDFKSYNRKDLEEIVEKCKDRNISDAVENKHLYEYYLRVYGAVLSGMVGEHVRERYNSNGEVITSDNQYGLMACYPVAAGYYCSDFDDFGAERTYGYKRRHLGHDMVGDIGTPIIAVEGGYVEALGWNNYGGWRVGIRSFDNQRYYYYAHLKSGHPYNNLYEGKTVSAGEVIGYLGRSGYSTVVNTDNICTPHLHIGLQLIFSPEQKDGEDQIWVDFYQIAKLLSENKADTYRCDESGDMKSAFRIFPVGFND